MFNINTNEIEKYFKIINSHAKYGHVPICALAVLNDNSYSITVNTKFEHAEEILVKIYHKEIKAMFVTLQPCISCGFKIRYIKYVFFGQYNKEYGFNIQNAYGGLYTNNELNTFFQLLR